MLNYIVSVVILQVSKGELLHNCKHSVWRYCKLASRQLQLAEYRGSLKFFFSQKNPSNLFKHRLRFFLKKTSAIGPYWNRCCNHDNTTDTVTIKGSYKGFNDTNSLFTTTKPKNINS